MAKFLGDWVVAIDGSTHLDKGVAASPGVGCGLAVTDWDEAVRHVIERGATTIITYPTLPALLVAVQRMATF